MHKRQAGELGRHWVHRPARPHEQDARVLPPHHAIERVLVLGIAVRNVGSAVRVRRPHERYVRLVAELHRRDGRTQLARCVKQHPHLRRVPRARAPKRAALLVAKPRQHGKRHKQLAADRADEVEHAPPLRKRQHGSVWSGCRAACVAVKVVVGARGPRAAHADPRRADGAREHAQPFISQVDGPAPGHEVLRVTKQRRHVELGRNALGQVHLGIRLRAGNLRRREGLQERTARDLGHLDVVRDDPPVARMRDPQLPRSHHKLAHVSAPESWPAL